MILLSGDQGRVLQIKATRKATRKGKRRKRMDNMLLREYLQYTTQGDLSVTDAIASPFFIHTKVCAPLSIPLICVF